MEEIKANEILRAENGKLYRIISATKDDFLCIELGKNKTKAELLGDLPEIIKHSSNIIDLIEVGDYVNGKKVISKWEEPDWREYFIKLDGEETVPTMRNIESIVTNEQFESMKYHVGGKE